jgi:hypothetical protein
VLDATLAALVAERRDVPTTTWTRVVLIADDRREAQKRSLRIARVVADAFGGHNARTTRPSRSPDDLWAASISYKGGRPNPLVELAEQSSGTWLGKLMVMWTEASGRTIGGFSHVSLPDLD